MSTQTTPEVWTSEVIRYVANDDCGGVRCTYVRTDRDNIAHVAARITGDSIGAEQPLRVYTPSISGAPNSYDNVTETLPKHIKTHDEAVSWWVKRLKGSEDDSQMGRQGTTDNPVPASVAGQQDDDSGGSGATSQHPQPESPSLVDAEDELATLIAGLLADGVSVRFSPHGVDVDVVVDPYDDDDGDAESLEGFGPDPLAALRVALDLDW